MLGHPLPSEGVTVVHCLADLSNAPGAVWIPCMTNLLREHEALLKHEAEATGRGPWQIIPKPQTPSPVSLRDPPQ